MQVNVANEIVQQEEFAKELKKLVKKGLQQIKVKENVYYPNPEIFKINGELKSVEQNIEVLRQIGEDNMFVEV